MGFWRFFRDNAPWLLAGALLTFLSSFGQTFFISLFAGEIRAEYGLTHGAWGGIYLIGTTVSAFAVALTGGFADLYRVRVLAPLVAVGLGLTSLAMALNQVLFLLPVIVFCLRYFGQGMLHHISIVAMARWFAANRGRALVVATYGFILGELTLPITFVWLKQFVEWRSLWLIAAAACFVAVPVVLLLLRTERQPGGKEDVSEAAGMDGRHWTRAEAIRTPIFLAMIPALVSFPAIGTAFWFHQVHFAEVKGWSHLSFVAIFPLGTLALAGSTLVYGWAIDRFNAARLMPIYLLPLILAFLIHWAAPTPAVATLGVILMGIAGGGQATLPAASWSEFFGTRHLGSIKSLASALMVFGSALGPGIAGLLIDLGIDFPTQCLGYAAVFLAASAILVVPVRRANARLAAA